MQFCLYMKINFSVACFNDILMAIMPPVSAARLVTKYRRSSAVFVMDSGDSDDHVGTAASAVRAQLICSCALFRNCGLKKLCYEVLSPQVRRRAFDTSPIYDRRSQGRSFRG